MVSSTDFNRLDYGAVAASFSLADIEAIFSGNLGTGINACVECCDRHVALGKGDEPALYWEARDGTTEIVSFAMLQSRSEKFAKFLIQHGVVPGDRVAGFLPRIPELLTVILGTWRAGAVYQPLFTAFGPKAVEFRLQTSEAKFVVTDNANRSKLEQVNGCPQVITVARTNEIPPGDIDFHAVMAAQVEGAAPVMRRADDVFMLMFTSGTTGNAKGVPVPLKALPAMLLYMRYAVDLRAEDRFWNIADPGWAYGLYYAVLGPLLLGHATLFYDGPFTVHDAYRIIQKYRITNLAGAPTAYRMLLAAGDALAAPIRGQLRVVSSAGEPLNPEVIRWFDEILAAPIFDHYGQTEIGMVVNNHHALAHDVRAGSAGKSMPGYRVVVVDDEGREVATGVPGTLAVDTRASPLYFFPGYLGAPSGHLVGPYYLSGDVVEADHDGTITFVGRGDDIITSSGYRIGPFDVESTLLEHPSVAETAVIGKPDPERTEIVKAFVVLRIAVMPSEGLKEELQQLVKSRLSAHAYPREIEFINELPKTPSGKIQRFLLRQREAIE